MARLAESSPAGCGLVPVGKPGRHVDTAGEPCHGHTLEPDAHPRHVAAGNHGGNVMSSKLKAALAAVAAADTTERLTQLAEAAKERLTAKESMALVAVIREIDSAAVPTAGVGREIVPVGTHEMEVAGAEIREVEWKRSDDNPRGECLSLRLRLGGFQFVFCDVPLDWKRQVTAVEIATGHGKADVAEMAGEIVRVRVEHFEGRNGTRAVVKEWLPREHAAANAEAAPSEPALDADDRLPF